MLFIEFDGNRLFCFILVGNCMEIARGLVARFLNCVSHDVFTSEQESLSVEGIQSVHYVDHKNIYNRQKNYFLFI